MTHIGSQHLRLQRIVRQRSLQRSCLIPSGPHPLAREKPAVS